MFVDCHIFPRRCYSVVIDHVPIGDSGAFMLRLTFLLSVALFLTLLIGGQDYGQLRPGLAVQPEERTAALALAEASPKPVSDLVVAAFVPDEETVPEPQPVAPDLAFPLLTPVPLADAPPAPAADVATAEPAEVWYVTAETVNVREGPGTEHAVLDKLSRGVAATVVSLDRTGWAKIRIEGDGIEGYVSTDFLSQVAP